MISCNCGGELRWSSHTIKTQAKLAEWMSGDFAAMPVGGADIEQDTCKSCGRLHVIVRSHMAREVLHERG